MYCGLILLSLARRYAAVIRVQVSCKRLLESFRCAYRAPAAAQRSSHGLSNYCRMAVLMIGMRRFVHNSSTWGLAANNNAAIQVGVSVRPCRHCSVCRGAAPHRSTRALCTGFQNSLRQLLVARSFPRNLLDGSAKVLTSFPQFKLCTQQHCHYNLWQFCFAAQVSRC